MKLFYSEIPISGWINRPIRRLARSKVESSIQSIIDSTIHIRISGSNLLVHKEFIVCSSKRKVKSKKCWVFLHSLTSLKIERRLSRKWKSCSCILRREICILPFFSPHPRWYVRRDFSDIVTAAKAFLDPSSFITPLLLLLFCI